MAKRNDNLWRYFKFRTRSYFSRIVLIFLFCFTIFPLIVLATYGDYSELASTYNYFYGIAIVLLVCAFVFPISSFSFTNSKRASDLYFSLPIKRQDLFIHNYLIGLLVTLVPVTFAVFLGLGTLSLSGSRYFFANLLMYGKIVLFYLTIYNLVTLIIQKCNNRFDSYLASLLLINLPLSLYYAVVVFLENTLLGFPLYDNFRLIAFISPVFSLFNTWLTTTPLYIYIIYLLSLLIVPILASIAFYNRKPEKSADASTSRLIYPLISYGVTFNTLLLTILVTTATGFRPSLKYLFSTFCALIVFLATRMLATRSFKELTKHLLFFVVYISFIFASLITIQKTGGFGYEKFVPEPETVLYLEVRTNFLTGLFNEPTVNNNYLTIEDQPVIAEFTKLQSKLIENGRNIKGPRFTLNFNYQRSVFNYKRRYSVSRSLLDYSLYYQLLNNKIWLAAYQQLSDGHWKLVSINDALCSGGKRIVASYDQSNDLIVAVFNDLTRLSIAEIYQNHQLPVCYLSFFDETINRSQQIPIYESFSATLSLLEKYDYEIPQANPALVKSIKVSTTVTDSPYFNNQNFAVGDLVFLETEPRLWLDYLNNISPLYLSDKAYQIVTVTLVDNSVQLYAFTK